MSAVARLDAEYAAHPRAEYLERISSRSDTETLGELTTHVSSGHTPYRHDVKTGDVGFVTVECISPLQFNSGKLKRVTEDQYRSEFSRQRITKGSVLCTIKRRICQAYPWLEEPSTPLAINQDIALIKPREGVSAAYLAAYLSSGVGQAFADRQKTEQMNPYISLGNLRAMPVVVASPGLQAAVEKTIRLARRRLDQASRSVECAEGILLTALGLADWRAPKALSYTARASEALSARRLDAPFFAPHIQTLLDVLGRDGRTLGDLATPRRQKFRPQDCATFNYIEIGDIDGTGAAGSTLLACADAPSRATWHVRRGDVITSTVRPIRRLSAQIAPEQDGYICSSGFVVINPRSIPSELLLTYLRLPVICDLLDLYASASMYPAITDAHIFGLPIPEVDAAIEAQVVADVRNARTATTQASHLLEAAKSAIEIAIEESEPVALALLEAASEAG